MWHADMAFTWNQQVGPTCQRQDLILEENVYVFQTTLDDENYSPQ